MFKDIVMIDFRKSPAERAKMRKLCGPYHWAPGKPGAGRNFYQASDRLACDPHGSTFDLRLELANDHVRGRREQSITAYWCDDDGFCMMTPIVVRLPNQRGFLAGWTMGHGMLAALDGYVWEDIQDAALAAHQMAERDAENELRASFEDAA